MQNTRTFPKYLLRHGRPNRMEKNGACATWYKKRSDISKRCNYIRHSTWCLVRRRRMARVFFGLKSSGMYFFFLYASLSAAFCFCDMTVRTCAIDNLTTFLHHHKKPKLWKPKPINWKSRNQTGERNTSSKTSKWQARIHLWEFVRSPAGDLGDPEERELGLQILQLVQELGLRLRSELVNLNPRYRREMERRRGNQANRTRTTSEDR